MLGDKLLKIDSLSVSDMRPRDIEANLLGELGSLVRLTLFRSYAVLPFPSILHTVSSILSLRMEELLSTKSLSKEVPRPMCKLSLLKDYS